VGAGLVVVPTVADGPLGDVGAAATRSVPVAATFLDSRDGTVVGQVDVGVTVEGALPGAFAAVSPDGRSVAVTTGLSTAVIDVRTRRVVERIELPADGDRSGTGRTLPADLQCCVAWTADGSRLLVATDDNSLLRSGFGELVVVDTATWREEVRYNAGPSPRVIRTSPDRRWIVVAGAGREISVFDAATTGLERAFRLEVPEEIADVAFTPDSRTLATVGSAGLLRLFAIGSSDREQWEAEGAVPFTGGLGTQVEWLALGRTAVIAGSDGTLSLFDAERSTVLPRVLSAAERDGNAALLMPDPASEIVVLRSDGTGHRYPADPAVWLRDACTLTGRDLTREEWDGYLPERPYRPACSDLG
jgi:WD40 repeat protein